MGGGFLLLQQRSKHPREMVITPKASTSHFVLGLLSKYRWGRLGLCVCDDQMYYLPRAEGVLLHAFDNRSHVCG